MPVRTDSRTGVYILAVLVYLIFIPGQFSVTLFSIFLTPLRVFILVLSPFILREVVRGRLRFTTPDFCLIVVAGWIALASYMNSGELEKAFQQGGSHLVDITLAYFIARVCIKTPRDLRLLLILTAPGVLIQGLIVFQEAVTHQRLLQPFATSLTGSVNPLRDEARLGLMRGAASFPHPILAGIFLASLLPIYLLSGLRSWPKWAGIIAAICAFFTMSSAALLGLIFGAILAAYDWLTEQIRNVTWQLLLAFGAVVYFVIEMLSNTGFYGLLVRYASLNTASAYNRVLIWRFGTDNIAEHPWFGIGYDDWVRPSWMHSDSFDHFWLIMALRFGIPASLLLIIALLVALVMVARSSLFANPVDARLLRGVAISLGVFALGVNSVSMWQGILVWFFVLFGVAVSLGVYRPSPDRSMVRATPPRAAAPAVAN
ncbi:O-antigen ligase family protein [Erythrobacter sp.]|jgi:hypothetical protein|uniref:O-antigen ligase family protein n=1 Tax=Erythrobacter sp. TaxID=1042 RepID=UPI002EAAB5FC|nr:O-antigen ligase family protein [Erythrobacter sp.]